MLLALCQELSDERFGRFVTEGAELDDDDVVAFALDAIDGASRPSDEN